ncbi:MAG: rhodanese-like domain-containing protein [Spirulinaceae cyanobacterium RM2_2_10]|nr:rhodanese-like domain-containing protein [Spirulinaceae cyanobacterium SM2_1_0]NJO19723.1 rhodanese-like domain-containing protein [Spirulinaceae cyanobacterium RM2_2_10]
MPALNRLPTHRLVLLGAIACLSLGAIAAIATDQLTGTMHLPSAILSLRTPQVTATQIQQGELGELVIFIDVRSPEEYAEDHITDSILIPITDIEASFGLKQIGELANANPNATLVIYCQTGPRSFRAYHALQQAGLATGQDYRVLKGGIRAWRQQVPLPTAVLMGF